MSFLHKTSPFQSIGRWLLIGLGLVLVVVLAISAYERYGVEKTMRERREAAEAELASLEARHATLEAEIEYLSGARGVEEEIRQQFDVAKPGEQVVVLVGDDSLGIAATSSLPTESAARWYEFWRLWR